MEQKVFRAEIEFGKEETYTSTISVFTVANTIREAMDKFAGLEDVKLIKEVQEAIFTRII